MEKETARIMEKLSQTVIPAKSHKRICAAILKVKGY